MGTVGTIMANIAFHDMLPTAPHLMMGGMYGPHAIHESHAMHDPMRPLHAFGSHQFSHAFGAEKSLDMFYNASHASPCLSPRSCSNSPSSSPSSSRLSQSSQSPVRFISKLGEGAFGEVWKAEYHGEMVAAKITGCPTGFRREDIQGCCDPDGALRGKPA